MMKMIFIIIEALLFPWFLIKIFQLTDSKKFIIAALLQFIVLYANQFLFTNHYICALLIIIINIWLVKNSTHKLDRLLIPMLYSFIIVLIDVIVLFVIQMPSVIALMNQFGYDTQVMVMDIMKTTLMISVTYALVHTKAISKMNLDANMWKQAYIAEIIILIMGIALGKFVLINSIGYKFLYFVILVIAIIDVLLISIVYKANLLHNENIRLITHKQNQEFNEEKLRLIKSVKNEIDAIDHRMFYIIFKIDHLLENNETDKIKTIIDKYKEVITKHNMIIDTSNAVFDCLLSLKINDLLANDVVVKTCVFVSEDDFYDNLSFINFVTRILDFLDKSKEIQLFINEEPGVRVIKVLYDECENIEELHEYMKQSLLKFDGNYKLNTRLKELKIVLR